MDEAHLVADIQKILNEAVERRRGLIAYSKMEAIEMDRRARAVERDALDRMKVLLPAMPAAAVLHQLRTRLQRMEDHLGELASKEGIADTSRMLESDDIVWRTFEDVLELVDEG